MKKVTVAKKLVATKRYNIYAKLPARIKASLVVQAS